MDIGIKEMRLFADERGPVCGGGMIYERGHTHFVREDGNIIHNQ